MDSSEDDVGVERVDEDDVWVRRVLVVMGVGRILEVTGVRKVRK